MRTRSRLVATQDAREAMLAGLAARQHGLFTGAQATSVGIPTSTLKDRARVGKWEKLWPGVYRMPGVPETWRQRLLAACLAWGGGAVGSHTAAATMLKAPGFDRGAIVLTVPRSRRRHLPHEVHRPHSLEPPDTAVVDAIPITSASRTLLDLSATQDPLRVECALDDFVRRDLVSLPYLRWRLRAWRARRAHGAHLLHDLVQARTDGVPQSPFETKLSSFLRIRGLRPVLQYPVRDGGRLVAVLDFAFPLQRVAVEADGYEWHTGKQRWARDLRRRSDLAALGWRIVHVTWQEFRTDADAVLLKTVRALASDSWAAR